MKSAFTTTLEKFDGNLWGLHVAVPDDIAEKYIDGSNKRIKVKIGKQIDINAALMKSKFYWFILINKQIKQNLGLMIGQSVDIEIEKDNSTYGMPMPDELSILLEQDEDGRSYFEQLTPGKQRSLIYIVSKVKNTDSRLNKALAIIHHLKLQSGALDFKKLNEVIKEFNQRKNLL